jgi:LCP family protein required for cell wall assembly
VEDQGGQMTPRDGSEPPVSGSARAAGPLGAAVGSLVWPGLGHLVSGQRRRGAIIGGLTLLALLVAVWLVGRQRRTEVVAWTLQPRWLRIAMVVAVLVLVVRLVVGLDAYRRRAVGRTPAHPVWHALTLATLVVLAIAPHAIFIRYAATQLSFLERTFDATETVAARPTPLPTSIVPVGLSTTVPPTTAAPASPPAAAPTTAAPTTTAPATWDGDERLTILLLGGDGGFDRSGVRIDTIIALSIEVATGDAVAFSIPRNWQRMQYPAGSPAADNFPNGYSGIANELYNVGLRNPHLFPGTDDPAGASVKAAVAQLLGTPIHYYALVDMVGVVEAIDLFGGIDIHVSEYISDDIKPITPGGPRLVINTRPGDQHFDGLTALAYMRARSQTSDYNRMTRQRCVVGALVDQVGVRKVLGNYTAITEIIADHLTTDIPLDRLPELLDVASRLDTERILTLNFIPPDYPRGAAPIELVRQRVVEAFAAETTTDIEVLELACGE